MILASDKTKLSQFRGDQVAWPVYLSIGNICKATRRQVSSRATILVGYIPVSKLECFTDANRSLGGYRLFHHCMGKIVEALQEAGRTGIVMVCADGSVRRVYPVVAAYVADHPEQCLVVNVKENMCPRGTVDPDLRGDASECFLRNLADTLEALHLHEEGHNPSIFDKEGLRPIYAPFWKDLPHTDIFSCITPDILHQLHKGVFKDHLVSWCMSLVGKDELDLRFKAVPDMPGLRHFKNGISHVSQWTGTEHKEMQKFFVAILAGAVDPKVLMVAQAVVDFVYYSQLQLHTTDSINALRGALKKFHDNKQIFIDLEIREHFNIPKIHSMIHYPEAIWQKGALDGYNTELPERLHIEYAKDAYRAGNRRDYIAHMTHWLQRQEAVDARTAFLEWERCRVTQQQIEAAELDGEHVVAVDGSDCESDREEEDLRFSPATTALRYKIAKRCSFPRTTQQQLVTLHEAVEFMPAFAEFVKLEFPQASYLPFSVRSFRVYKQVKIERPWSPYVSAKTHFDRIRATAAIPERGRTRRIPAHFDTVLVIEDLELYKKCPKGSLSGEFHDMQSCKQRTIRILTLRTLCS